MLREMKEREASRVTQDFRHEQLEVLNNPYLRYRRLKGQAGEGMTSKLALQYKM